MLSKIDPNRDMRKKHRHIEGRERNRHCLGLGG